MSAAPNTQTTGPDLEQERRRIAARLEEIARLSESNVVPGAFYGEMLKRLLETLAAPAGAVWARTAQGNLQLQYQINLKEVGLDQNEEARNSHGELLRQAMSQPRPFHVPPRSSVGVPADGKPAAGNLTNHLLLIAPVIVNQQTAGLIEVWQNANRPPQAITGYLQFMTYMAELSSRYQRNQVMGHLTGQQQVWTQLEVFARQVHASLNPTEVAYQVANEGRRLIECDRVSVAVRHGSKARIEAVSGADVVERRSNLIRLMRKLSEAVIKWGEKLIFNGARDDSLPPKVLTALDAYLAESNSKLLVVQPLKDERESGKRPPRSALVMECFEPPSEPQQLIARLDVVASHATPALYNAVEHRRIPGRWVWQPVAKLQEGIGGKAKAISAVVVGLASFLIAVLLLAPYELEMDCTGKLLPSVRRTIYAPTAGKIVEFKVNPQDVVQEKTELAVLESPELFKKLLEMNAAIEGARQEWRTLLHNSTNLSGGQSNKNQDKESAESASIKRELEHRKDEERRKFLDFNNANAGKLGEYYLMAPPFTPEERGRLGRKEWTVLSGNFKDEWQDKTAKPSDPILKLGAKDGPWEIELRIPQKHISQVLKAYETNGEEPLNVNFILRSDPARKYRGILTRVRIASEAIPNRDEKDESEPEVIAYVSIDDPRIDPGYRLSRESLVSGTEVRAKVRCGKHCMGYSLFYGVWEFLYEKVVFFF